MGRPQLLGSGRSVGPGSCLLGGIMSRVKTDFSRVSLNQLCMLTGHTSRTLKKMLAPIKAEVTEDGTLLYDPRVVLTIRNFETSSDEPSARERLDPQQEKARLDKLKADKVELEILQMRKKLIPIETIYASWEKVISAARARLLGMPTKLAPKLAATSEARDAEKIIKAEVYQALKEMSEYEAGLDRSESDQQTH